MTARKLKKAVRKFFLIKGERTTWRERQTISAVVNERLIQSHQSKRYRRIMKWSWPTKGSPWFQFLDMTGMNMFGAKRPPYPSAITVEITPRT